MGLIMLIAVLAAVAVARPAVGFEDWPRAAAPPAPETVVAAGPPVPRTAQAPVSAPAESAVAADDPPAEGPASAQRGQGSASPAVGARTRGERASPLRDPRGGVRDTPAPEPPAVPVEQGSPPAARVQADPAAVEDLARRRERAAGGAEATEKRPGMRSARLKSSPRVPIASEKGEASP